jgi:hypothetical protein
VGFCWYQGRTYVFWLCLSAICCTMAQSSVWWCCNLLCHLHRGYAVFASFALTYMLLAASCPVQSVAGCDNVVAVVPKAVRADAAAECQDAVVLRAPDALAAKELRKRLTASASQMAAVAGLLEVRGGGARWVGGGGCWGQGGGAK